MSRRALSLATRLCSKKALGAGNWHVFAPARLAELPEGALATPIGPLREALRQHYRCHEGHVIIGACGIAVRTLAPLLTHKSRDPGVVVVDPAGRFAISLVSGHLGGGNELARYVAHLLGATPVITTASDSFDAPALDLLFQDIGLRPVDWDILPRVQANLLERQNLHIWDPMLALWPHIPASMRASCVLLAADDHPPEPTSAQIAVHWRQIAPAPLRLRVSVPCLTLGIGCRKNIAPAAVTDGLETLLRDHDLARESLASVATVTEKASEPAIVQLAQALGVPLQHFAASTLADIATPNPSQAAGKRFGTAPFSVCEAAALLGAGHAPNNEARLLVCKTTIDRACTLAVAMPAMPEGNIA